MLLILGTGITTNIRSRAVWSGYISNKRLGVSSDGFSHIYVARGGSPEENVDKVIELMGGIGTIIDSDDIIVLKPNSQWWEQGMTNTNSMKELIHRILELPDFTGEIIIADNHQYQQNESRGWTTNSPNGHYNLNQLVDYFQIIFYNYFFCKFSLLLLKLLDIH